jgi:hypothetical protein
MSFALHLSGQSESGDSIAKNFVAEDTAGSEKILKTPELQVEKTMETLSPANPENPVPPTIPMYIPGMKSSDFMMPPRYWGYEKAITGFRYTSPEYDPWQMTMNLNLPPRKSLLDLIRENPFMALIYGVTTLAGMMNNTIAGEDKINIIRLDNMVQSRSWMPETAIPVQGPVNYENGYKRIK